VAEDIGNRAPRNADNLDEDFGNLKRDEQEDFVDENIGNRLRPGEQPAHVRPKPEDLPEEDEGDDVGNR
jgi:hypothetical protein